MSYLSFRLGFILDGGSSTSTTRQLKRVPCKMQVKIIVSWLVTAFVSTCCEAAVVIPYSPTAALLDRLLGQGVLSSIHNLLAFITLLQFF